MRICHFEDSRATDLEPISLTRPVFELLCGCSELAEKQARYFGLPDDGPAERGALVRPLLAAVTREQFPVWKVNDLNWLRAGKVILVNGRWLPPYPGTQTEEDWSTPSVGVVDGEVAWAILPWASLQDCEPATLQNWLKHWLTELPTRPAGGVLVRYLWELVDRNSDEIRLDAWLNDPECPWREDVPLALVGPASQLRISPSARIDPLVVADTTKGPVIIGPQVVLSAFTRLEGPCYIGPGTQVLGARIRAGTSIGPQCRVGGEIEASVMLGYSNKYHDGFLGHAYIGSWVNMGAGTSNSDLRNDYGEVRVSVAGEWVSTGRTKVGCFLGDHTKTGLGTLLNTGTNAGAFCNLLPTGGLLPRAIPSFCSIWNGQLRENAPVEALLTTAARVLKRRGKTMTAAQRELVRQLSQQGEIHRHQALRDAELRQLRRSA